MALQAYIYIQHSCADNAEQHPGGSIVTAERSKTVPECKIDMI